MATLANTYDAIILGAGGAGLMCAAIAGQRGKRVLVIDHADQPGKKILISGGGRCNFTNIDTAPDRYICTNRHFVKSAFGRYKAQDFINLVNSYNIAWHEKELGQLFCDGSAKQIVAMLLEECAKGDVTFRYGEGIGDINHGDGCYNVCVGSETMSAPSLVIATGGPSIPKMGATGFAYELARQFGLKIVDPRPALVPLTLGPDEALFRELSGVSADVVVRCGKRKFPAAALFTYKGLSGPAILQISSYWRHGEPINIDFLPTQKSGWLISQKKSQSRVAMQNVLGGLLPDRLAEALSQRIGLDGELANIPNRSLEDAERRLADWQFSPTGTEGFAKAEVTVGGIHTDGLSSRTMEAKKMAGLYVIGEAVDVTGWLGGYNFQWAWASGWAAGQEI